MIPVTSVVIHRHENYEEWRALVDVSRWNPDGWTSDRHPGRTAISSFIDGDDVSHSRIVACLEYLACLTRHYTAQEETCREWLADKPDAALMMNVLIEASEQAIADVAAARIVLNAAFRIATPRPDKREPA